MSTPTDLEARISSALAAVAEQVQPEHLSPRPAPVVPLRRRTPLVVLAVAASILVAVVVALNLGPGERRVAPAPQPDDPEVVLPSDIGRDWDRAKASPPAELDLDGDGTDEKVRFLAEPTPGTTYDGRVRLETTLTGDGTDVFGLVDLGSTLGLGQQDPIDADGDGDQEMVLYRSDPKDAMSSFPIVLDLRDDMLVVAPPSEPQLLRNGTAKAEGGTEHYEMAYLSDYWIEDGTLHSTRSVRSFASLGMSMFRPQEYEAEAFVWRLDEGGVLRPDVAPEACLRITMSERRACEPGEADSLPVVAVAEESIGIGEGFSASQTYRFDVLLEAAEDDADATVVVEGADGRRLEHQLRLGAEPRVFTQPPTKLFYDGASLVVTSEDGDEPSSMQVLVQFGDELRVMEPVGDVPFGTGYSEDGRAFRTWLSREGAVMTAHAETADESGPWALSTWTMVDRRTMVAAPLDTVCFEDPIDPGTARRC